MPELDGLRPKAMAIAYRMLGSVAEAEDVVQEAMIRVHTAVSKGTQLESAEAFLTTVTTRLAIDRLRSAQRRRETYVGEWLPEPVATDNVDGPGDRAVLSDSLSLAFLVVLERLTPVERAVFLLRDIFAYPYEEIASILQKGEPACRQVAVRARRHVEESRPRHEATRAEHHALAHRFLAAAAGGDRKGLEELLAGDVSLHGDGGGRVPALGRPMFGRNRVAAALVRWVALTVSNGDTTVAPLDINGQPGAVGIDAHGEIRFAIAMNVVDDQIQDLYSIVNPDKLRHLAVPG